MSHIKVSSFNMLVIILLLTFITGVIGYIWWSRHRTHRWRHCVIVFSRYPTPGTTKTRLIPVLGPQGAAYCQTLMTEHILDKIGKCRPQDQNIMVEVAYKGGSNTQMNFWLGRRKSIIPGLVWREQVEGDLGHKMKSAVIEKLKSGVESVIVIGSDIPGINEQDIAEGFDRLQKNANMVLGKAEDGGYYLVGFNQSSLNYLDEVFEGIDWGTDQVFKQQTMRAKEVGADLKVLSRLLSDVDTLEELPVFEKALDIPRESLTTGHWSIVIPVLNEAQCIEKTLKAIVNNCCDSRTIKEIIISDGGSKDDTISIVKNFNKTSLIPIIVINSPPGRGFQLSTGASKAKGSHLLFLHGDSIPPKGYEQAALKCLNIPGNVAGAFKFGLDVVQIPSSKTLDIWETIFWMKMKFLEMTVEKRCRAWELPYGDQGLFMSRNTYNVVEGYPETFLMEDYILVKRLQNIGHISLADEAGPFITSSRRWQKWGLIKVTGMNYFIVMFYKLGVHPDTLARWYYGDKLPKKCQ